MAKKRKKPKAFTPSKNNPEKIMKFPVKKALILLLVTAVLFVIYQVMISLEMIWIMHAYWIALGVLAMVYIAINRGALRLASRDELPKEWTEEQKTALIDEQKRRRAISRPILYVIIAIMLTLIYDTCYLFYDLNLK